MTLREFDRLDTTLQELVPGYAKLAQAARAEGDLEERPDLVAGLIRSAGLPGMLVPSANGGLALSPRESVQVTAAIASTSPSMAVALTMHNFSVASLAGLTVSSSGPASAVLDSIAQSSLIMCSGFAEGGSEAQVALPTLTASPAGAGKWWVNGTKKPCTMAADCDIVTASVGMPEHGFGIMLISRSVPGMSVEPFWGSPYLGGTGSHALVFTDVEVADTEIYRPDARTNRETRLDQLAVCWFNILLLGAYVGAGIGALNALVDKKTADVLAHDDVARSVMRLSSALRSIERLSDELDANTLTDDLLNEILEFRYTTERDLTAIATVVQTAAGGIDFVRTGAINYLAGCLNAFQFHPPFWRDMKPVLTRFMTKGRRIVIR